MNLLRLFSSHTKWTKDCNCRDAHGNAIPINIVSNEKKKGFPVQKIARWSLYGALAYYYSYDLNANKRYDMLDKLRAAIKVYCSKNFALAEFNNHPQTNFEDVVNVLKIAHGKECTARKEYA